MSIVEESSNNQLRNTCSHLSTAAHRPWQTASQASKANHGNWFALLGVGLIVLSAICFHFGRLV
jgi:hypothetical protein